MRRWLVCWSCRLWAWAFWWSWELPALVFAVAASAGCWARAFWLNLGAWDDAHLSEVEVLKRRLAAFERQASAR